MLGANTTWRALVLLALGILILNGCTSTYKNTEHKFEVKPNEKAEYSSWDEFSRSPASTNEDVKSRVVKETINIEDPVDSIRQINKVKACGDLVQGESSHTALNNEHASYYLKVDCKSVEDASEGVNSVWIKFGGKSLKPQQKGWLTRWKRKAAFDNLSSGNARRAVPYICFKGETDVNLCKSKQAGTAFLVNSVTSRIDEYKKW